MKRCAAVLLALALAGPALAQTEPPIRSRIGSPEAGGGYREDVRNRIGPRGNSFRQPYDIRSRVGGEKLELLDRPAVAQAPPQGSSLAARRAQRERTLRLRQQQQQEAVPPPAQPRRGPPEPKSY